MTPIASHWFVAISIVAGFALFGSVRRLGPAGPSSMSPVAVIVPARNEAETLPDLLSDLSASEPPADVVVVVDDNSDDGTAEVARHHGADTVVESAELPPGWSGKPWACHQGAGFATTECGPAAVLVFLDADVRLAPGALSELVSTRERLGGVVSVQPFHEVPTWREHLSAVFNLVSMMGIGAGSSHPTAMFGPVVCCTARDYLRVGGHAGVRSEVTEDVALAHRFLDAGVPVRVFGGGRVIRFRMYPKGWRTLVEGWTKNIATGATAVPWWRTAGVALWVSGLIVAAVDLIGALAGSGGGLAPSAMTYAASVAALAILLRSIGSFRPLAAVLHPVLVAFFCAVFVRSAWCTSVRRRVRWKGRTIDLGQTVPAPVDPPGLRP